MNIHQYRSAFFLALCLALGCTTPALSAGIQQKQSESGSVELTNIGEEDDVAHPVAVLPAPADHGNSAAKVGAPQVGAIERRATVAVSDAPANAREKPELPDASNSISQPPMAWSSSNQVGGAVGANVADSADATAARAAQYRNAVLNLPTLPNGQPANPAIQRRYLMVKKSDFFGGN